MAAKTKTFFTAQPSGDREKKNLLFLNLIKNRKSTSRTEISKQTDVNAVTVSNYINSYLKKALVLEGGYDLSSGGRRPELVELNREWGHVAGIDIGENTARAALVNLNMETLAFETIRAADKKEFKNLIKEIVEKLLSAAKSDMIKLKKIGITAGAASENTMNTVIRLKEDIEEAINVPILIGSASLSAAFGEKNANPNAKECPTVLYIHEDAGEAVLVKGDEFYQMDEEKEGYMYFRPWKKKMRIVNQAREMVAEGVGTKIVETSKGKSENITLGTVIKAAEEKDEIALDLVKMAGVNLGFRIAYLVNLFEPESVIVGGGIEKAGHLFMEPLETSVKRFVLQRMLDRVRLAGAVLGEDVCAKGAAFLAVREAFVEA